MSSASKDPDTPACRIGSQKRVFPTKRLDKPVTTRLSIIDASITRFSFCAAIWLFDKDQGADAHDGAVFERLEQSFRETLNHYPHWSGQVHWASLEDEQASKAPNYRRSCGRPAVTYGTASDPGVDFLTANYDADLKDIVPSREARASTDKVWIATDFPQAALQANTQLALSSLTAYEGLAAASVQLTRFNCGGYSVSLQITHCISDAHCLLVFAHAWAAQTRRMFGKAMESDAVMQKPLFDPAQLDQHAGEITSGPANPEIAAKARALPMHRFDWWDESAPGYPSWATPSNNATKPSVEQMGTQQLSPSTPPPWPTWHMALPVEHAQIRFSAREVAGMKAAASATLPAGLASQRISRLDSLLSHVWKLIVRARQLEDAQDQVYLNVTLGLRKRVSPPLPDTFLGSPILLMHVAKPASEASTAGLGTLAGSIRETMSHFTPEAVSAYIHDAAHEVSPQRLWQAFLGSRHTLVTSWTQVKAYEVDFWGRQKLARYVQGVMPRMDGLLQVIDVGDSGDFDVSLGLDKEVMKRLLQDPELRAYEQAV